MLKGRDRWGTEVSVATPDDPGLWLVLVLVAAFVGVVGVAVSGLRWRQCPLNPWLAVRTAVRVAAQRGRLYFWVVWTLFSTAFILLIAAAFVGLYGFRGA